MPALAAFATLTFVAVLSLTSYKNFFYDEWDFVSADRGWDWKLFFLPHNEHWSTIPILVWKVLFVLFGISSHLPYQAVLLGTHITAVFLLFLLVRSRCGDIPAFAAAVTLLVLGSGATNIVWAFQIGFVGSIVFGLLAMLLLEGDPPFPRRLPAVSMTLLASLMCSGVGLAFLAAVALELLLDRRRRWFLFALVVPVVGFAVWFLEFGAGLPGTPGAPCPTCVPAGFSADIYKGPLEINYLMSLAKFVAYGLEDAVSGVVGLSSISAIVVTLVAAAVVYHLVSRRALPTWQIGLAAGAVVWYALTGLGRGRSGPETAGDPHYLYVGAVFLLPILADAARDLPWNWFIRPVLAAAFALCIMSNAALLLDAALNQIDLMRVENVEIQTAQAFRGAPDMALDQGVDPVIMPQLRPRDLFAATDELGSPVPPTSLSTLRKLPAAAVDRAMVNLFGDALVVRTDSSRTMDGLECRNVESGSGATLDIEVPDNQWLALKPTVAGDAFVSLGYLNPPAAEPLRRFPLDQASDEWIHLPNTGQSAIIWQLRVQALAVGTLRVCGTSPLQFTRAKDVYRSDAASWTHGPGWSVVSDSAAASGKTLKAAAGTPRPGGGFGTQFVPDPVSYDIWYRLKVPALATAQPQLVLTVTDVTTNTYVVQRTLRPLDATTNYSWVLVATDVKPPSGHLIRFQVNIAATLSTDWYIDQAVMQPSGSPPPAP